ncbi:hypothetical protein ALC62_10921 [Cyphomyrmex costatus]|uniref:MADF domain-containing protein n=1 Tax=Cyphomyrmex costatus TaxID=456900 RepID=A0A151IDE2_9HYME|nr:hypothetical protein ALC62_10921 [Cyphomyrmex costatus]
MSLKWNENVSLIFLNAYQKHPCLWNPYYVKYYDCLAKNDALKDIIKELNIPELNISDCLEQIKVIRKKYEQEQTKVIKGLQSGKSYESPFAWFPIIAKMLTKVIDDESKLQNRMGSVETISPIKNSVITPYNNNNRYKNVSNFPCMQDYKIKSGKNKHESEGQNNAQLLQCPSCGWENVNLNKLDIKTVKKANETIKPLNITVPCPEYSKLTNKFYEGYKAHRITDSMYQGKYENIIPCPTFSRGLPSYIGYSADMLRTNHMYYPQSTCYCINQQTTPVATVASKPKFCIRKTQLPCEQLFPEKRMKQVTTIVEHRNKEIQNTVCVPKAKIDIVQKCRKEILSKPLISQEVSKQVAVNTVKQCDKEIQNTICASPNNQVFQICSSTQKVKQIDENTMKRPTNDMRNTIDIKLKTVEGSMPNFILITTDENYLPLIQSDLKEFTTNKCQDTASEVTVCEQIPCTFPNQNIHSGTISAAEVESLSCLEKAEKDNAYITMFIEILLELMKHDFVMSSKNDWSKRQLLNKFYCRSKLKSTCPSRKNSVLNSIQTQDTKEDVIDQFIANANSKNVEVLYEPSISKIRDYSLSENDTTYAETMNEPFVKDKDVTARTENHDIGLNISLPLRDSETQYTLKQLQDTGIATGGSFEEKINVATQNCEPILIRVIKSNNSGGVLKLDKETCVRDAHVLWNINKYSKNMYQKYSIKKYYDKLLYPGISHIREKEMNCIDYRTSLLHTVPNYSNGIYKYYQGYRSSLPHNYDWIKANSGISSTQRVSRIPLYARSHKYTQRRTDLYRMSRSYV